ncbi:yap-binding protein [Phlyctema vagabunda]|uniref:Yap-binding protein n=1 Tax=Phlyctema vagabunda TaxID=108571 RepID=A0ABR4P421_9HELO
MATDPIKAITQSLPPATDPLTYLTILESHISPDILPTLNDILQDAELTQSIGWDLIHLLVPIAGAEKCLGTIARLGNPREVVLKITEALSLLQLDDDAESRSDEEELGITAGSKEPTSTERFCILVDLLSIVHPRIKTKYPSRFLSSSLMSILSAYRPSPQATLAVLAFVHTISGKKRPALPGRKSSVNVPTSSSAYGPKAPDPEAQEEDPSEAAIQQKLLQSFITHVLEEYVNESPVEWAARLQESFDPTKVVSGRKSLGEMYKEDPTFEIRDTIVGKLVALARDLGLTDYPILLETIRKVEDKSSVEDHAEDNYPSSPEDVPLSKAGSLFLMTYYIFSTILFAAKSPQPSLTIFPDHMNLVKEFIGVNGPETIGSEPSGVIDALLAIGLWLENSNKFVAGPLEDEDFLQHLQTLSLLSANNASPTLRAGAHILTSSVLHAHPTDRLRLTFISDTLEHCPYETLKASAVAWLKEELMTAKERGSQNVFGSSAALAAVQPYLFPDLSSLSSLVAQATDQETEKETETGASSSQSLSHAFPFHMAVLNFIFFLQSPQYAHVVPDGMLDVVQEVYVRPLREALAKAQAPGNAKEGREEDAGVADGTELELLSERIALLDFRHDGREER